MFMCVKWLCAWVLCWRHVIYCHEAEYTSRLFLISYSEQWTNTLLHFTKKIKAGRVHVTRKSIILTLIQDWSSGFSTKVQSSIWHREERWGRRRSHESGGHSIGICQYHFLRSRRSFARQHFGCCVPWSDPMDVRVGRTGRGSSSRSSSWLSTISSISETWHGPLSPSLECGLCQFSFRRSFNPPERSFSWFFLSSRYFLEVSIEW